MTISKDTAQQIAYKLTEKSRKNAEVLNEAYRALVTELYESQTPDEIKEIFKKHPDWIYTRMEIVLDGNGFRYERVCTVRPVITNSNSEARMEMTNKVSTALTKAKTARDKAKAAHKSLVDETKTALLNLKTTKNISDNLPDAIPFLPPPMSNALVVNIDSLKKKLNTQPGEISEKKVAEVVKK
jgi:hypothetical protein